MAKESKKKNYDKPVKIQASFNELVKESVSGNPAPEPKKMTMQEKALRIKAIPIVQKALVRIAEKNKASKKNPPKK